ncbi:hypothetical protein [Streptomyces mirabilis]|uniref:hypothetical protein n=1 Tax=Streptomyces mirabilis TaxID=68239 RepID=UPI003324CA32
MSASYLFASAKASVSGSITKSVAVTTGHTYSHNIHSDKRGTARLPATSVGWHYWETSS